MTRFMIVFHDGKYLRCEAEALDANRLAAKLVDDGYIEVVEANQTSNHYVLDKVPTMVMLGAVRSIKTT